MSTPESDATKSVPGAAGSADVPQLRPAGSGVISLLGARQQIAAQPLEEIPVEALSAVNASAADAVAQIREEAGLVVRSESLF